MLLGNVSTQHFELFFSGKSQPSPSELLDRGGAPAGLDSYLNKANTWLSGKKDAAERLLKHTSKTDVKGFFGGLESKLRSSVAPKSEWASAPPPLSLFINTFACHCIPHSYNLFCSDGENPGETKPKSPGIVAQKSFFISLRCSSALTFLKNVLETNLSPSLPVIFHPPLQCQALQRKRKGKRCTCTLTWSSNLSGKNHIMWGRNFSRDSIKRKLEYTEFCSSQVMLIKCTWWTDHQHVWAPL